MVEGTPWRTGEFLRILILFLWQRTEGATTGEVMEAIARSAHLTVEESLPAAGSAGFPLFEIITRQAMSALEKSGWLARQSSLWFLTDEGRLACKDFRQASDFYLESQKILAGLQEDVPAFHLALEHARDSAWQQIRRYLLRLPRHELRFLVQHLLLAMNYHLDWVAPAGKQRGLVDLVAIPDPLGMQPVRLMIHIHPVGQVVEEADLQALLEAIGAGRAVLCFAPAGFSTPARRYAAPHAPDRLILLDLPRFVDLWIEYEQRLPAAACRKFPLEAVHFLALDD